MTTIKAKAGKGTEIRSAFLDLERHSRAETGCIQYDLHQSIEDPDMFLFHEIWTGEDTLARHASSEFMSASTAITRELIASTLLQKFQLVS